jgi:dihydrolipoamide dehydrogenase
MCIHVPHIYGIGDVNGKMGLAHMASGQGMVAAEAIAGRPANPLDYEDVPRCTYPHPELASVGLTEWRSRK